MSQTMAVSRKRLSDSSKNISQRARSRRLNHRWHPIFRKNEANLCYYASKLLGTVQQQKETVLQPENLLHHTTQTIRSELEEFEGMALMPNPNYTTRSAPPHNYLF